MTFYTKNITNIYNDDKKIFAIYEYNNYTVYLFSNTFFFNNNIVFTINQWYYFMIDNIIQIKQKQDILNKFVFPIPHFSNQLFTNVFSFLIIFVDLLKLNNLLYYQSQINCFFNQVFDIIDKLYDINNENYLFLTDFKEFLKNFNQIIFNNIKNNEYLEKLNNSTIFYFNNNFYNTQKNPSEIINENLKKITCDYVLFSINNTISFANFIKIRLKTKKISLFYILNCNCKKKNHYKKCRLRSMKNIYLLLLSFKNKIYLLKINNYDMFKLELDTDFKYEKYIPFKFEQNKIILFNKNLSYQDYFLIFEIFTNYRILQKKSKETKMNLKIIQLWFDNYTNENNFIELTNEINVDILFFYFFYYINFNLNNKNNIKLYFQKTWNEFLIEKNCAWFIINFYEKYYLKNIEKYNFIINNLIIKIFPKIKNNLSIINYSKHIFFKNISHQYQDKYIIQKKNDRNIYRKSIYNNYKTIKLQSELVFKIDYNQDLSEAFYAKNKNTLFFLNENQNQEEFVENNNFLEITDENFDLDFLNYINN